MSRTSDSTDCAPDDLGPLPEPENPDTEEEHVFAEKAILYRFSTETNEWLERGHGVLKVLKSNDSGVYRILMRENRTYLVRANHRVPHFGTLTPLQGSDRQFKWITFDFATGEEERELFAVRFAQPETAAAFKAAFEKGQEANKAIKERE